MNIQAYRISFIGNNLQKNKPQMRFIFFRQIICLYLINMYVQKDFLFQEIIAVFPKI